MDKCTLPIVCLLAALLMPVSIQAAGPVLRVATFNVSMEGGNYVARNQTPSGQELPAALAHDNHPQIRNIAEIIQRVRPDVLLLNEFDYHADAAVAVRPFIERYLNKSQQGLEGIDYPYFYQAPVNTGIDSGFDLDGDGIASGIKGDAFGYGLYPGQYGMLLLSRYPIDFARVRQFQKFLWKDMPGNLMTSMENAEGEPWYSSAIQERLRLSSKSHWDIPVTINGKVIHVLASHPTPPVFDGPEDRNGRRNHDEVRFWVDYLSDRNSSDRNSGENNSSESKFSVVDEDKTSADYIYDDSGQKGGIIGDRFVILGDLNASVEEGDAKREAIRALLGHPKIQRGTLASSDGGRANRADSEFSPTHTTSWGMRADYVLPSKKGWKLRDAGVFWPPPQDDLYRLVKDRQASSDHRLVWVDLALMPDGADATK